MNEQFLRVLKESFITYLNTSARSNEKLKVLHGFISEALSLKLGSEYTIYSLGFGRGKEKKISGRYMDKNVDITIKKGNRTIAGVAVKFVMSNYSQNSNNYFENMLGETANIRTARVPYFQVFAIPELIPYFDKSKRITRWERITAHNLDKYIKLSNDNTDLYYHTPNKTLISILSYDPFPIHHINNYEQFKNHFLNNDFQVGLSENTVDVGAAAVYNDFEQFIDKVYHSILSI